MISCYEKKMKIACPECANQSIHFFTIWLRGRYFRLKCSSCREVLKVRKIGNFFWRNSSYIVGVLPGLYIGVILGARLYTLKYICILIFILVGSLIMDFLLDVFAYGKGRLIIEKEKRRINQ